MASILRTIKEVSPKPLALIGLECKKQGSSSPALAPEATTNSSSNLKLSSSNIVAEPPKKKDICPLCSTNLDDDVTSYASTSPSRRPTTNNACPICARKINAHDLKWIMNEHLERQKIGQGQFSIYKGVLVTLGREKNIAVKAFESADKDEFIKERDIQCKLHHPNIVNLIGHCEKDGLLCLLVPFKKGGDLSNLIHDKSKALTPIMALTFAEDICRGLKYLHARNIIHRDLKPGNILLNRDQSKAFISDFGTTRQIANHMTTFAVGTMQYLAPEVFTQSNYFSPVDIYSLAIIMWEMLTRELPWSDIKGAAFSLQLEKKLQGAERLPFAGDFDPVWKEVIEMCWAQDPKDRPSADALLRIHFSRIRSRVQQVEMKVSIGNRRAMSLRPLKAQQISVLGPARVGSPVTPNTPNTPPLGRSDTGSPQSSPRPNASLAGSYIISNPGANNFASSSSSSPGVAALPSPPSLSPNMSPQISPRSSSSGSSWVPVRSPRGPLFVSNNLTQSSPAITSFLPHFATGAPSVLSNNSGPNSASSSAREPLPLPTPSADSGDNRTTSPRGASVLFHPDLQVPTYPPPRPPVDEASPFGDDEDEDTTTNSSDEGNRNALSSSSASYELRASTEMPRT